jgi:hypothetical protein
MKHILTILAAAVALMPQSASAQIDKSPWYGVPTNPATTGVLPSGSASFKYPNDVHAEALARTTATPTAPALPPYVTLPPAKYDGEYRGGQLIVTKWNDYSLIQLICKDTPNAVACSYKTYDPISGKLISCLIMLGPAAHNNERVLRHEIGHCNGWSDNHEGAR